MFKITVPSMIEFLPLDLLLGSYPIVTLHILEFVSVFLKMHS